MAKRPIFLPDSSGLPYVESMEVEFQWFAGFSKKQAQKSIASLHEAAMKLGICPILETSSKSPSELGISLSAFNLSLNTPEAGVISVECAYQGSKVFQDSGPYHELYAGSSREAKTDPRLRNSGEVTAFDFLGKKFPTEPKTAFYDWLYITALGQLESRVVQELKRFRGFSDIAFNPKRSINCQAHAVALFVALNHSAPDSVHTLIDWDSYFELVTGAKKLAPVEPASRQLGLPLESVSKPGPKD